MLKCRRKHIATLFAEVKGAVNLIERFDPEPWFGIVDDLFKATLMTCIISRAR